MKDFRTIGLVLKTCKHLYTTTLFNGMLCMNSSIQSFCRGDTCSIIFFGLFDTIVVYFCSVFVGIV